MSWDAQAIPSLAAVALLETLAVPLPSFGRFSTTIVVLIGALLNPAQGPIVAGACLFLQLCLSFLRHMKPRESACDFLVQGLALACALPLLQLSAPWLPGAVCTLVYALLQDRLPAWLGPADVDWGLWSKQRARVGMPALALGCLGLMLSRLEVWNLIWLLPMLISGQRQAGLELIRLQLAEREQLQKSSREAHTQLRSANEQLDYQRQEATLTDQLTRGLGRIQTLPEALRGVAECTLHAVPSPSLALYLANAGRLEALHQHGPQPQLSGIEAAYQQGRILEVPGDGIHGLAFPMEREGVLYVGRPSGRGYTDFERHCLTLVAKQASLGLQSVRWVERLHSLLEAARVLGASREIDTLWDRFRQLCADAVPHQAGVLFIGSRIATLWPHWQPSEPALMLLLQEQRALRVDRLGAQSPAPGLESLVSVPLGDEEGYLGAVMLFSTESAAYRPQELEVLQLLGVQMTAALRTCQLQTELQSSQAQLVQSSKLAAVGLLAAGVAHELNSPLTAALLHIGQALRNPDNTEQKLSKAREALTQARSIIDKLLLYSREGSSGYRRVNLSKVVHDTLSLFLSQIEEGGVQVRVQAVPEAWVDGNSNELQQVILNLLINARDAAHQTQQRDVLVRVQRQDGKIVCEVEDRGPGIPADEQQRIFEPFFTTKPVGQGTGLGLAVATQIVKQHGGTLTVRSQPGQGSTFVLALTPDTGRTGE